MTYETEIVQRIENLLKGSSNFIVEIGNELSSAKQRSQSVGDPKPYISLYTQLSFGRKVGEKYIAISKDDLVVKHLENCPPNYNSIYDLLLKSKIEAITGLPAADVWTEVVKKQPYDASPSVRIVSAGLTPTSSRKDILTLLHEVAEKAGNKPKGIYGGGLKAISTPISLNIPEPTQSKSDVAVMSINLPQSVLLSKQTELAEFQREVRALWKRTMKMSAKYVQFPSTEPDVPDEDEKSAA